MTVDLKHCDIACAGASSDVLNQRCACEVLDTGILGAALAAELPGARGLDPQVHASLFSRHALFVDRSVLEAIGEVAAAVFEVARNASYVGHVLRWAPDLAWHDPGSVGGVLGLDFHLTIAGPRLVEVNTNPGGLLLNAMSLDAVRACTPAQWTTWTSSAQAREVAVSAWLEDMREQLGRMPQRVAIVDIAPREQFLHPEFELYARAFRDRGVSAVIRGPEELTLGPHGLGDGDGVIDAVYNRLTDFGLVEPGNETLAAAYQQGLIALTPHPRAHALFSDKRNLTVLGDRALLESWGVRASVAEPLQQVVPRTVAAEPGNRDALWKDRKQYFFKPANGYGSRGSYRGDKLTRRTWDTMASSAYVAQAFARPGMRLVHDGVSLKADIRCFASSSGVLLFAARLYQGQATNMRTPGGGFAAVLTTHDSEVDP